MGGNWTHDWGPEIKISTGLGMNFPGTRGDLSLQPTCWWNDPVRVVVYAWNLTFCIRALRPFSEEDVNQLSPLQHQALRPTSVIVPDRVDNSAGNECSNNLEPPWRDLYLWRAFWPQEMFSNTTCIGASKSLSWNFLIHAFSSLVFTNSTSHLGLSGQVHWVYHSPSPEPSASRFTECQTLGNRLSPWEELYNFLIHETFEVHDITMTLQLQKVKKNVGFYEIQVTIYPMSSGVFLSSLLSHPGLLDSPSINNGLSTSFPMSVKGSPLGDTLQLSRAITVWPKSQGMDHRNLTSSTTVRTTLERLGCQASSAGAWLSRRIETATIFTWTEVTETTSAMQDLLKAELESSKALHDDRLELQ